MLTCAQLSGIPEELANRMMMRHGSTRLLRALHGEPEPVEPVEPVAAPLPTRRLPSRHRAPYVPVAERDPTPLPMAVRKILAAVAEAFNVSRDDLTGKARGRYMVVARVIAIRLIRNRTNKDGLPIHSATTIGGYFGRDHSTILHALDRFEVYCRQYPEAERIYREIGAAL